MKQRRRRRFPIGRILAPVLLAALVIVTFPLAGFRPQAGSTLNAYEQSLVAAGFPVSYAHLLDRLHEQHPAWRFEPYHTGLNWASAVAAECSGGRSLVVSSANDIFKSKAAGCYDPATGAYTFVESGYVTAGEFAVSYFMDPRNFLTEEYILQFESLAYHETDNELAVIQSILAGSVLDTSAISYRTSSGAVNTIEKSYAQLILEAGRHAGVNPFFLAAKIRDEVGSGGATISGTVSGYEGLYNYYNIQAYGASGVQQSLAWAAAGDTWQRPWTNPERSVVGGAEYIRSGYIDRGQSTSYFQRFNVVNQPYYGHQYMTAIRGAALEASNSYEALSSTALNAERTFVIPVYENMPQSDRELADGITLEGYVSTGVANASVNLRSSPTTSQSNRSGRVLPEGTPVTILEEVRSCGTDFLKYPFWYKISSAAGEGYVCADYVNANYMGQMLEMGTSRQPAFRLSPSSADEVPTVSSTNGSVVSIGADGTVLGIGTGLTTVTAAINNGSRVNLNLSVVESSVDVVPVAELSINAERLTLGSGETYQLGVQILPQEATFRDVIWSTDNPSVATVGSDGTVCGVGGGTAVIRAASADGAAWVICTVTVDAPVIEEPEETAGGLVDLDTRAAELESLIADLEAIIRQAEELDAISTDILAGEEPAEPVEHGEREPLFTDEPEFSRPGRVTAATTSFAVTVLAPDGTPLENALVELKSASGKTVSTASYITDGQYLFEYILNGSYTAEASAAGLVTASCPVTLRDGTVSGEVLLQLDRAEKHDLAPLYYGFGAVGCIAIACIAVNKSKAAKRRRARQQIPWRSDGMK